jgi:hypothetical protein
MRLITVFCAALFLSAVALCQMPGRQAGPYIGYEPYVPLITTPQISLQSVSPNPVGATNATYGLLAGARNSTISIINGNTSSNYTEGVWYSGGGAPLMSAPEVSLMPHPLHGGRVRMEEPREEGRHEHGAEVSRAWTYYAGENETSSAVEASGAAKTAKRAAHTYTNSDVENENQKNGTVKYDGKTEKIQ